MPRFRADVGNYHHTCRGGMTALLPCDGRIR